MRLTDRNLEWFTGWWFQSFFIFHSICDNPSHGLIFFSRWLKPPTSLLLALPHDLYAKSPRKHIP